MGPCLAPRQPECARDCRTDLRLFLLMLRGCADLVPRRRSEHRARSPPGDASRPRAELVSVLPPRTSREKLEDLRRGEPPQSHTPREAWTAEHRSDLCARELYAARKSSSSPRAKVVVGDDSVKANNRHGTAS